jgi:hypothetical protein
MILDHAWVVAFLFTQAVEVPIYSAALQRHRPILRFALAFGASLLTHPIVWAIVGAFSAQEYWKLVAISEAFAISIEAGFLRALAVPTAFAWSLLANGSSLGLGLLCRSIWGVP